MSLVLRSHQILGGFLIFWGGEFPPPEWPRINTGQSGASGDGSPLVGSRDKDPVAAVGCLGGIFAHLHIILLKNSYRKCVFRYIDIIRNKK